MKPYLSWLLLPMLLFVLVGCNAEAVDEDAEDSTSQNDSSSDANNNTNNDANSDTNNDDDNSSEPTGVRAAAPAFSPRTLTGMSLDCGSSCEMSVAGARQLSDGSVMVLAAYSHTFAGQARRQWHWVTLNDDFTAVDTEFADNGVKIIEGGDPDYYPAQAHAWDSTGRLLVLNHPRVSGSATTVVVERYLGNGDIDTTFGSSNQFSLTTPFASGAQRHTAIAILPEDRVVLGGTDNPSGSNPRAWTLRVLTSAGQLDASVHGDGEPLTFEFDDQATDDTELVGIRHFGDYLYLFGERDDNEYVVMRLDTDDFAIDSSFGIDGVVSVITDADAFINDLLVDANGKVVVVGVGPGQEDNVWSADSGLAFHVYRYNANGTADTSFNSTGRVIVDFGISNKQTQIIDDVATHVYQQANGKLMVVGHSRSRTSSTPEHLAMARILNNGTLDESFDFTGDRLSVNVTHGSIYLRASMLEKPQLRVLPLANGQLLGITPTPNSSQMNTTIPLQSLLFD